MKKTVGSGTEGAKEMTPITYISEQPTDYAEALAAAGTLDALRATTGNWIPLAEDAHKVVMGMTPADFKEWRSGLAKERKGQFAGEAFSEKFGAVMMPEKMLRVSMIAMKYGAPWGCTYLRLKENGQLEDALK